MEKKKETRGRKKLGNRPVKSKGSPRKPKPSIDVIQGVLREHYGIITESASKLGVTTATLYNWINSSSKLTETFKESRNLMIDTAESALMKNIKAGKETSIIFTLKCLGRDRNWIDKQEIDVNQTIQQIIINVDSADTKQLLENFNLKQIQQNNPKLLDDDQSI